MQEIQQSSDAEIGSETATLATVHNDLNRDSAHLALLKIMRANKK
jgi:hypothetical protein